MAVRRACSSLPDGVLAAPSLPAAVAALRGGALASEISKIFVVGGAAAYAEALAGGAEVVCDTVYLTRVFSDVPCDVRIPALDSGAYALASWQVRAM